MIQKFWTSEKLLSLSALLVSLCTLVVFIYQTNLIRQQQYMSVYPHLIMGNGGTGTLQYQFVLINRGIGPAIIKSLKIERSGKSYSDVIDYVEDMVSPEDSIWYFHTNLYEGQLIQAKENISVIQLTDKKNNASFGAPPNTLKGSNKLHDILNHDSLTIEITYESIYQESWTFTNGSTLPVKN